MKIYLIKSCILLLIVCHLLVSCTENKASSRCLFEKVNTSFLQLNNDQATWPLSAWESLFKQAHKLGIKHIIIQWSAYNNTLFYPKANQDYKPLLFQVINAARKAHISITMGLHYDQQFWSALEKNDAQLQNYLANRLKQQIEWMPDLINNINAADPSGETVNAWYISDEIDDINWQNESRRSILKNYLKQLIQLLKKQKPNWPISISTYSTGKASIAQVTELYKFLFAISDINKILFQDSIGTKNLTLESLETYLKAISSQLNNKEHFGIISELFTVKENQNTFEIAPANRVLQQLKLAKQYSNTDTTVFSFFLYVLPNDPLAKYSALYPFWKGQINHCNSLGSPN